MSVLLLVSRIVIDEDAQWFEWASESKLVAESGLNNIALGLE